MNLKSNVRDIIYFPVSDSALRMDFGKAIDLNINDSVRLIYSAVKARPFNGVYEIIPSYCSILFIFDPDITNYKVIVKQLKKLLKSSNKQDSIRPRLIHIPVCYDNEFGEDINDVAEYTKLSVKDIIEMHSKPNYLIYMLGFLPGFAYLGGLNKKLITPRLQKPRTKILAGAVGIGGEQTGIYPLESPGGWRLIGRTPIKPYDPYRDEPFLYKAGDYVKFESISKDEYYNIEKEVEAHKYSLKQGFFDEI
ncbi:MAG: 5-oxoprolinase subunit PxpB [Christensenellaceae bacterium]|jgi:KipI family sensor histidine kinase inhibitor|nr:5-oxoprolinase subunit PxpB [Christensenellaceae bacterium]